MDAEPPRLQRRNVEVFDSNGVVVAGFWQYGTLLWEEFYKYLMAFIVSREDWIVFQYDPTRQECGAPCPPVGQIVQPGHYILLAPTGEPVRIGLEQARTRPRVPTHSNTPAHESHYRSRAHARDGKCLITGRWAFTYNSSRLKATHIFPRAHNTEWTRKGYPGKITDTANVAYLGGPTKIDSVQNVITLRSDLHDAWDNYEFGVDPNNNYCITAFTNGNDDINGRHLQLDHIQDPTLRPLDDLFTDHFMQGLFKHMRGAGEVEWTYEDYDDVFGNGSCDLSNPKVWETREGKEQFELVLADRLFHQTVQ